MKRGKSPNFKGLACLVTGNSGTRLVQFGRLNLKDD
ncbi:hypothetical protein BO443_60122 [Burkholderia orbicola]